MELIVVGEIRDVWNFRSRFTWALCRRAKYSKIYLFQLTGEHNMLSDIDHKLEIQRLGPASEMSCLEQ